MYKILFRETFEHRDETITVERGGCRPSRIRCFRLWVQKLRTSSGGGVKKRPFFSVPRRCLWNFESRARLHGRLHGRLPLLGLVLGFCGRRRRDRSRLSLD